MSGPNMGMPVVPSTEDEDDSFGEAGEGSGKEIGIWQDFPGRTLADPGVLRIRCHQLHAGPDQLLSGPPGGAERPPPRPPPGAARVQPADAPGVPAALGEDPDDDDDDDDEYYYDACEAAYDDNASP
ncbi:hypothetical protein QTO34_005096 [Cnephaeus nilssonii]|uniref:Uncharacterized protein n=1 Tax=Cnephaeus nilssonii TaxID=3371016 RepID=A0AA40LHT6_CNENI|nr:hypothetical protein QTO34_005096 [Eptesicus nilssonii]